MSKVERFEEFESVYEKSLDVSKMLKGFIIYLKDFERGNKLKQESFAPGLNFEILNLEFESLSNTQQPIFNFQSLRNRHGTWNFKL